MRACLRSLVVLSWLWSSAASAAELHVPGQHPTLGAALGRAAAGDTIRVHGGVHTGHFVLSIPVHLLGDSGAVLDGGGRESVVTVTADDCTVMGFRISGSGRSMTFSDAGVRLKAARARIERNHLSGCLFGIYLERSSANIVRGNVVEGITDLLLGDRGSGIHLFDSHDNLIEDNRIDAARDGIYIDHSNRNLVRRCTFRWSRYGLHYMSADDNRFVENRFLECIAGTAIMFSRRVLFDGNWFVSNRGFSAVGVLFKDADDTLATNNFFAENSTAIVLDNSMNSQFRRNEVLRNDVALHLFSGSDNNVFTENNFRENLSPILLTGKRTTTRWAEGGRGNHWSEYRGYDLDGDGIGDLPHRIENVFEFLESEFPALRLFLVSPAAAAIRAGENAVPMFDFSNEVDPAPLVHPVEIELGLPRSSARSVSIESIASAALFGLTTSSLALAAMLKRRRPLQSRLRSDRAP